MTDPRQRRFSPEVRERAVRLVQQHQGDHPSEWAAIISIAAKIGCTAEALRRAVRMNRDGDGRAARHFLERELRWMEPYARSIPGADILLAELILVQRRVGEEWDERTRKEVYAASHKLSRSERDLRSEPPRSLSDRFR